MSSLTAGPWTVEEKKADYQTDEGDKYHTIEYIIRGIDQSSSQYIARVNRKEDAIAIVSVLELLEFAREVAKRNSNCKTDGLSHVRGSGIPYCLSCWSREVIDQAEKKGGS